MASIYKKMIRGKPYYYARECKRVDGKPKIVWQKYLGRPQDIIDAMTEPVAPGAPPQPREAEISDFGAVAMRVRISRWHENGHDCDRLHTGIDIPREITDPRPHHEHHIEEDVES